jgi:inhibitor of cysteine peptidase
MSTAGAINRFPNMRHTRVSSLLIAAALATGGAAHAGDQSFRLAVGRQMPITLQENPSTGYRWQVDTAASHNLSILRIEDKGFSPNGGGSNRPLVGAPGIRRWSIEALRAGQARVSFVHRRPWEAAALRRTDVTIEVTAR